MEEGSYNSLEYDSSLETHYESRYDLDSEWNNVLQLFYRLKTLLADCNEKAQNSWEFIERVKQSASVVTIELEDLEKEISDDFYKFNDMDINSERTAIGIDAYSDVILSCFNSQIIGNPTDAVPTFYVTDEMNGRCYGEVDLLNWHKNTKQESFSHHQGAIEHSKSTNVYCSDAKDVKEMGESEASMCYRRFNPNNSENKFEESPSFCQKYYQKYQLSQNSDDNSAIPEISNRNPSKSFKYTQQKSIERNASLPEQPSYCHELYQKPSKNSIISLCNTFDSARHCDNQTPFESSINHSMEKNVPLSFDRQLSTESYKNENYNKQLPQKNKAKESISEKMICFTSLDGEENYNHQDLSAFPQKTDQKFRSCEYSQNSGESSTKGCTNKCDISVSKYNPSKSVHIGNVLIEPSMKNLNYFLSSDQHFYTQSYNREKESLDSQSVKKCLYSFQNILPKQFMMQTADGQNMSLKSDIKKMGNQQIFSQDSQDKSLPLKIAEKHNSCNSYCTSLPVKVKHFASDSSLYQKYSVKKTNIEHGLIKRENPFNLKDSQNKNRKKVFVTYGNNIKTQPFNKKSFKEFTVKRTHPFLQNTTTSKRLERGQSVKRQTGDYALKNKLLINDDGSKGSTVQSNEEVFKDKFTVSNHDNLVNDNFIDDGNYLVIKFLCNCACPVGKGSQPIYRLVKPQNRYEFVNSKSLIANRSKSDMDLNSYGKLRTSETSFQLDLDDLTEQIQITSSNTTDHSSQYNTNSLYVSQPNRAVNFNKNLEQTIPRKRNGIKSLINKLSDQGGEFSANQFSNIESQTDKMITADFINKKSRNGFKIIQPKYDRKIFRIDRKKEDIYESDSLESSINLLTHPLEKRNNHSSSITNSKKVFNIVGVDLAKEKISINDNFNTNFKAYQVFTQFNSNGEHQETLPMNGKAKKKQEFNETETVLALQNLCLNLYSQFNLIKLALREDNPSLIEKIKNCPEKFEVMDNNKYLYKCLVSVDSEPDGNSYITDASTNTSSPKQSIIYRPSEHHEFKRSDSRSKINKGTLQFVLKELLILKKKVDNNIFNSLKQNVASNDSVEKTELAKCLESIEVEIKKIRCIENQVDHLIEEIQQRLEVENELDDMQKRLEKEFVSKEDFETSKHIQDEALYRIKKEAINETQLQLTEKLNEINDLIKRQIQEQTRMERARTNSEISLRKKFEHISDVLQSELYSIQAALKGKDTEGAKVNINSDLTQNLPKDVEGMIDNKKRSEERNVKCLFMTGKSDSVETNASAKDSNARQSLEDQINENLKEKYLKKN